MLEQNDPDLLGEASAKASSPRYLGSMRAVKDLLKTTAQEFLDGLQGDQLASAVADPLAKWLADVLLGKDPDYPGMPGWNEPGGIDRFVASQVGAEETDPETVLEHMATSLFTEVAQVAAYAGEDGVTDEQWQWQYEDALDRFTRLCLGIQELPAEDY